MTISVRMDKSHGGYPMRQYKVEVNGGGLISLKFKNKDSAMQRSATLRMPRSVASQLAHALLLAADGDLASPILLNVDETEPE